MLYDALVHLMRSQSFNSITVTDLVEAAQIGRTTFYRNFDEIEDILRMRCDQVFDELVAYIIVYRQEDSTQELGVLLKPMLRYFYLHSDIIDLLLRAKRIDILQDSFRERAQVFRTQIAQHMQIAEEYVDYAVEVRLSVMIAIVSHWVKTGKRQAPDELADTLKAMISNLMTVEQLL